MSAVRLAAVLTLVALPAFAQSRPVALVEAASPGAPVEALDYVVNGQIVTLSPGHEIVLSYFASCRRETITGGTVTVAERASTVEGGRLAAEALTCDRRALRLTALQSSESAAGAIRLSPMEFPGMLPRPEITVYSVSPLVRMNKPAASDPLIEPDHQRIRGQVP